MNTNKARAELKKDIYNGHKAPLNDFIERSSAPSNKDITEEDVSGVFEDISLNRDKRKLSEEALQRNQEDVTTKSKGGRPKGSTNKKKPGRPKKDKKPAGKPGRPKKIYTEQEKSIDPRKSSKKTAALSPDEIANEQKKLQELFDDEDVDFDYNLGVISNEKVSPSKSLPSSLRVDSPEKKIIIDVSTALATGIPLDTLRSRPGFVPENPYIVTRNDREIEVYLNGLFGHQKYFILSEQTSSYVDRTYGRGRVRVRRITLRDIEERLFTLWFDLTKISIF